MKEGLLKTYPDKKKISSMLRMSKKTMEMIRTIDFKKFPSNVLKEYYDVMRELISVIMLIDGYKTYGEGAHKKAVEYLGDNYGNFSSQEIMLIDELRVKRNKISYDGFFVREEYVASRKAKMDAVIDKLVGVIEARTRK